MRSILHCNEVRTFQASIAGCSIFSVAVQQGDDRGVFDEGSLRRVKGHHFLALLLEGLQEWPAFVSYSVKFLAQSFLLEGLQSEGVELELGGKEAGQHSVE